MGNRVLTVDKLKHIIWCRNRYLAGEPIPASFLERIGEPPTVAAAKEIVGIYLDPNREPVVEDDCFGHGRVIDFAAVT